jgi:hypothetical protein
LEFLVNDLSMAGQFHDLAEFKGSMERVMRIRRQIMQHGYSLGCHRSLASAQVTRTLVMQQAVGGLSVSERRAWMQWLTRHGPHWEDDRLHSGNDYLEADGEIVTDSAVGEAAVCCSRGLARELVSFDPSAWLRSPIEVKWARDDGAADNICVANHWDLGSVQRTLETNPQPVASWAVLATRTVQRCTRLTFSEDAFAPLEGHPFAPGAADRICTLINTLDRLKGCFNDDGTRNPEGHRLYQDHFTGDKAWFSDASDSEKRDFEEKLTFRHPRNPPERLFCTWHGKVKTPQYRVHFSWPVSADIPLFVVYVGPKITKR